MSNLELLSKELELLKKLHKIKAQKELINFITYTDEKYDAQWFQKTVCDYVDKLANREIKKLMIFMPPQHSKSTISSINFPAFLLGKNPNEKIILGCYNKSKATDFVKKSKRVIKSQAYSELFPNTKIQGSDTDEFYEVNNGTGYVKSAGMDSGVTGFTASCIIIDDPLKGRNEANSKTIRDKTWGTFIDDFQTRQDNNSITLLLFTRWHMDDFGGRILDKNNEHYNEEEAKEWTILIFQALKEENLPIIQAEKIDDPREIDEALWEKKHSSKKYKRRRIANPTGFASLDQQRPSPEDGNKIKKEWWIIKNESELPFNLKNITADFFIDGAFTEKTENDETGLGSFYFDKSNNILYVLNISGIRKELYELLEYFKEYANQNHRKVKSSVYIELKASGHPLKSMLSKNQYGGFNTREIPNKTVLLGKYNRVENSEPFISSGKVVLLKGSWNKSFIDQCSTFPNGIHDDLVDIVSYAIHKYFITGRDKVSISYED